ncbi:MAG: phytanoyl-CoA dioxygenase family protein [Pseudomonadota bacterium]|nr:phytanoyl-CoA dioxygenase family protein [Pseudomonadota bacterium]
MPILTADQLADFGRDGFLVARGFYDRDEIDKITRWVDEIQYWPDTPGKHQRYYEPSLTDDEARILNRMENFTPYHPGFRDLFIGSGLQQAVAELFGEPAVLFKEKVNFKLPGGDGFKPHQDHQAGWGDYADLFISVLVGIDRSTVENGCLEVVSGHHTRGMFEEWEPLSDNDMRDMTFVHCPTEPGDAIFFDSFAPHGSSPNLTNERRRLLYVTYNRASAGDHREQYYADKRKNYPQDCERDPDREYVFRV